MLLRFLGSVWPAAVGFVNSATVQSVIAIERTVFHRERAAGMYAAMPYALAQVGLK